MAAKVSSLKAARAAQARAAAAEHAIEEQSPSPAGHNTIAVDRLRKMIDRIENLNTERKGISDDISAIFAEAKASGFNVKVMRKLIKARAENSETRKAEAEVFDVYALALGLDIV